MMDKTHREVVEELAALIHMTRFMADTVDRVVADPQKLREQLDRLEAELQTHLLHADIDVSRRAN